MKQIPSYRRWFALAAVAMAPVLCPKLALAQYAVGSSGHALDANNQVGSGGFNTGGGGRTSYNNNDIIFGDITGLSYFHGNVDNFGSGAFQAPLAGSRSDAFIAQSSGAPTPYSPTFSGNTPTAFFGASRGVAPPPGTILLGSSGAAIGTTLTPANPLSSASVNQLDNVRIGTTNIIGIPGDSANSFLSVPGAPGSSNSNIQDALSGSLLTGVTLPGAAQQIALQQNAINASNGGLLTPGSFANTQVGNGGSPLLASNPNSPGTNGLTFNNNNVNGQPGNNNNSTDNGTAPGGTNSPTGGSSPLNQPINSAVPLALPQNSPAEGSSRINDSVGQTGQNTEGSKNGAGASQQLYGPQYSQYQRQLQQYNNPLGLPNAPKPRVVRKTRPGTGATTQPSGLTPDGKSTGLGTPGQSLFPNETTPGAIPPAAGKGAPAALPSDQQVVKYSNIASSVRAKSLHDLLAKGDDALKDDRYKDAITAYETGARVAPNNQMITLGLANADLAGGFYAAAEQNIRRAFANDANVLLAQQDLTSMISSSRLDYIRKDLMDLARKNPKQARYWLLLSYLDYNSGHAQSASDELQKAHELAGVADETIPLMATYWNLPAPSKDGGLNK